MEHAGDTTQSDIIRNNNNTGDYNLDKLNMNHETESRNHYKITQKGNLLQLNKNKFTLTGSFNSR